MDFPEYAGGKRKLQDDRIDHKKSRLEQKNILDFSDCVLTEVLSHVDSYDLYSLSNTCTRFRYLIKERKLWKHVDILNNPMCANKFKFFFENFNDMTNKLLVKGINKKEKTLTSAQFMKMIYICDNLTVLAIENQYINSDEVRLNDFPVTLMELSLKGTHITGKKAFLEDAHKNLINLHTLILDDCKWFHEHSLMALSKLLNLENLSLYNCRNLNDSIAYMSVTARFGFQKLLRIDARYTSIGDQFLKCFHCIKTLREIYLESPPVRKTKGCTIMDEIKKWYKNDLMACPNVVIFNPGNEFKRSRGFMRMSKKFKKSDSPRAKRDSGVDCLKKCIDCTSADCGILPAPRPDEPEPPSMYDAVFEVNFANEPSDIYEDKDLDEVLFCDDVSDSEDDMPDFGMFHSDVTDAGVQWFCSTDPENVDNKGNESVLFEIPYRNYQCKCKEFAFVDPAVPGPSGMSRVKELAPTDDEEYLDDIEVSEISQHFHFGIRGKRSSRNKRKKRSQPKTVNDTESAVEAVRSEKTEEESMKQEPLIDSSSKTLSVVEPPLLVVEPSSPSAEPLPPTAELPPPTAESPPATTNPPSNERSVQTPLDPSARHKAHLDTSRRSFGRDRRRRNFADRLSAVREHSKRVILKGKSAKNGVSPSIMLDFTLGSPLHVEIINNRQEQPGPSRERNEDGQVADVGDRDLRVIIERLDPGLHIVIDREGRLQFGPMRENNYTKLKVFMARGYKMITDHALRSLMDIRLEVLDVTGTSVTENGIKEFLMVNPDCRVIHERFCNCNF